MYYIYGGTQTNSIVQRYFYAKNYRIYTVQVYKALNEDGRRLPSFAEEGALWFEANHFRT